MAIDAESGSFRLELDSTGTRAVISAAGHVLIDEGLPREVLEGEQQLGRWLLAVAELRDISLPGSPEDLLRQADLLEAHVGGFDAADAINIAQAYAMYLRDQAAQKPTRGAVDGASFVFDVPPAPPAVWGNGNRVLWAQGEGFLLVGPQGVGKTTIAQQLVLGLIGRRDDVLGLPVASDDERRVLYLAMDRPAQIARSLRRMVSETDRDALQDRLAVWRGPLPFNVTVEPRKLATWARDEFDAGTIVVDSYKDLAPDLSAEATGAQINAALQEVVAEGMQWIGLHHQRKSNAQNARPNKLADVYGSNWLTAGTGSVFCIWGDPGDDVVEGIHLKQPAEVVGPLSISHDHERGRSIALDGALARGSSRDSGATRRAQILHLLRDSAGTWFELSDVADVVKASDKTLRDDLKSLVNDETVETTGGAGRTKARWRVVE